MTYDRPSGGRIRLQPRSGGPAAALVVLLHGVGSSAQALAPLGEAIAQALPQTAVAALDGFEPFDLGRSGFQWFSIAGVTEQNRSARIAAALPRLEAMIEQEQAQAQVGPERTALVGFSQGAFMALHLAASARRAPAAVAGLAGRVAGPLERRPGPRPAVLLSHGLADAIVPAAELDRAAAELRAIGCAVETQVIPGHGHAILPQQVESVLRHLAAHLQATAG